MIRQLAMGTDLVKGNGRGLGETVGENFLRELSLVEIDRRIRTLYGDEGLSRGCHDSHSFEFVRSDFTYNTRGVSHKSKHNNQTSGEKLHDGLTGCLVVIYYYWASRDENGSDTMRMGVDGISARGGSKGKRMREADRRGHWSWRQMNDDSRSEGRDDQVEER